MYVCVLYYVQIRHPRPCAQHACVCIPSDTIKIVSIYCMLTLNVAHRTTETPSWSEGSFEAHDRTSRRDWREKEYVDMQACQLSTFFCEIQGFLVACSVV